jgi:hypothetical protein
MRKAIGVAIAFMMLLSLATWSISQRVLAQVTLTTNTKAVPKTPEVEKDDVDEGRFGHAGLTFRDYLLRREEMVAKLRGLPFNVAGNPRNDAIRLLEQQQAALLGKAGATSGTTGGTGATARLRRNSLRRRLPHSTSTRGRPSAPRRSLTGRRT